MSMDNKDGFVWLEFTKDGKAVVSTVIPGETEIGAMANLQQMMQKAGFEEDNRLGLDFKPDGSVELLVVIDSPNTTVVQANLCLKSFKACLKDSGVIKNPITSHIHEKLCRPSSTH